MRNLTKVLLMTVFAASLTACGSGTPTTNPATGLGYGQAGYMNGGLGGQGGCVPLGQPLYFSGQGIQMDNVVLLAGNLPQNSPHPGTHGQVVMGGGGAYGGIQYAPKQSSYGNLTLSVSPNQGSGTLSGHLELSPQVVSAILASSGNYGYGQQQQQLCVSSIALDVAQTIIGGQFNPYSYGGSGYGASQGSGQINQALVYLYLANGQPIGPLSF